MFPVLMSAPPIYDAQEIEEYRQKSAEMIEIDGRTLSRYEWTQEQRKIETAIRAQKDISNLARAAGLTDEARKASAKIDRLYDRYDQISAAAGLEKQPQWTNLPSANCRADCWISSTRPQDAAIDRESRQLLLHHESLRPHERKKAANSVSDRRGEK